MKIAALYEKLHQKLDAITTDTRSIKNGDVFFALKGERFNGNDYAVQALKQGADIAIIDQPEIFDSSGKMILVEDVLSTLQSLAKYHRQQREIPVLGITGTNGKTTTKELIRSTLSQKYEVLATEGNLNNHIGVPLTLLKIREYHQFAVIEMGANHPSEIAFLTNIALPDMGIVTNVGKAHLEGFGSFEGVVKTKKELYDFLSTHQKTAFVFEDQKHLMQMSQHISNKFAYSFENIKAYCYAVLEDSTESIRLNWVCNGMNGRVHSALFGKYNATNILAAICVGAYMGLNEDQINKGIASYSPQNNRSQIIRTERKNKVFLDAYNANPVSMSEAIQSFLNTSGSNKVLILGDMFELGKYSDQEHQNIIERFMTNQEDFKKVIFVGANFSSFENQHPKMEFYKNAAEVQKAGFLASITNAVVLIKGSRGMRLEQLLGSL